MIAPAASSAGSAGVASTDSEDVQSSSVPSRGVSSSPGASVRPLRSATGGAKRLEASAAPACSLHGAASSAEQPEASAANPMPDIFGGLYSGSEEGAKVVLLRAPSPPAVAASPPRQRPTLSSRRPCSLSRPRRLRLLRALRLLGRGLGRAGLLGLHRMIGGDFCPRGSSDGPPWAFYE